MNKPNLPIFNSDNRILTQLQTVWKAAISPAIQSDIVQGRLVEGIDLDTAPVAFNHLLGRKMVGWIVSDQDAQALIARSQPLNDKTLTLTASAPCTVSVWCY